MCIFFQVEAPVPVAAGAWGIATLDINADGIPDIVVADNATKQVSLLVSNGEGGFASAATFAVGKAPAGLAVGDFDGDGKQDVVVADSTGNTISVLINNGSGGFDTATTVNVNLDPTSVTTADVNGDKKTDIIVADSGANVVSVLTNDGAGGFTRVAYGTGKDPTSVVAANLNGDARPDLVVADAGGGQVSVLLNNGSGSFAKAVNYAVGGSAGSDPQAVATANLNGKQDVVVADGNGMVSVLLNNGTGTLQPAQNFLVGSDLTAITVATLDGSGTPDILVADAGSDSIFVLQYGSGALSVVGQIRFAAAVVAMTVADVNDDGRPDIIATLANGSVDVALNQADYSVAQALAAYAANPALTGMTIADTGANLNANLNALQSLAAAGALVSVTDANYGTLSFTSQQMFADSTVLTEVVTSPAALSAGPLVASGGIGVAVGEVLVMGTLTNTGNLAASTAGGDLAIVANTPGSLSSDLFANTGTLTIGNGYTLTLQIGFANRGAIHVNGGAELDIAAVSWANSGAIAVSASTLRIGGAVGIGQLGSIVNTGGVVDLAGTLSGPGTLKVGAGNALGTVELEGTIANATIVDGGGGMRFVGATPGRGSATLQSVTYDGTLWLNLSQDAVTLARSVQLSGAGGTGAGTVQLTGAGAQLAVTGIATLDNATINIGSHVAAMPAQFYAEGNALTLGKNLSLLQVGTEVLLQSDRAIGDGIVSTGTITAGIAGGDFVVAGGNFTNSGALLVGNGDTVVVATDREGNLAGGTLSGGLWSVSGASTLWLPDDANVTALAANMTLAGSGTVMPTITWFSATAEADVTLPQTLRTVTAAGALTISGTAFASTVGGGLDVLGKVILANGVLQASAVTVGAAGAVIGYGLVAGPVANNGTIKTSGGTLDIAGSLTGSGTLAISAGTGLDLGSGAPASQHVVFAAASGRLVLAAPTSDALTISGFVKGDTIDLGGFVETADTYSISTGVLTVTGSGGATVALTFVGSYTQASFKFASDKAGGTLLTDPPPSPAHAVATVAAASDLTSLAGAPPSPEMLAATAPAALPEPAGAAAELNGAAPVHPVAGAWPPAG